VVREGTRNRQEDSLGEDHSSVASTYNNMANVLRSQGKLEDVMELYGKALEIFKKTLGEDHLSVANTYTNMANGLPNGGPRKRDAFFSEIETI
jgi:tetratricopeptide (TPR) repeat protein